MILYMLELPKSITADYLSNFHYDSREELYEDWLARWDQQLGYLSFYLRYRSLQIAMKKGSTAQTAMENAMRVPGYCYFGHE